MAETIAVADHNLEFLALLSKKKEQVLLTHSRIRQEFLTQELKLLSAADQLDKDLQSFFSNLAKENNIADPENWRISFQDKAFIRVAGETDGGEETSVLEVDSDDVGDDLDGSE